MRLPITKHNSFINCVVYCPCFQKFYLEKFPFSFICIEIDDGEKIAQQTLQAC